MKSFLVVVLLFVSVVFVAHAQQADDKYIGIYGQIQQAERFAGSGDAGEALAAYTDAETSLLQFQRMYPNWNPTIVKFRLNQVEEKIVELKKQVPSATVSETKQPQPGESQPAETEPATTASQPATIPPQTTAELDSLHAQLQAEREANQTLQAKLKEALSVQPAAVDPRELAKAQEKIRWLMKENDLLKASQAGAESPGVATRYVTNTVTVVVTNKYSVVVTNFAAAFAQSTSPMVVTNYVRVLVPDTNALEMARLNRAAAVKNFNDEHDRAEQLANELKELRQSQGSGATNTAELVSLRTENATLKTELAKLRSDAQIAALEQKAMERRLRELQSSTNASAKAVAYESRIHDLTQERDNLLKQLDQAKQQPGGGGNSDLSVQIASLNSEVKTLRARLVVAEAQPVPFTAEELALFKGDAPKPSVVEGNKQSAQEMPADTAELVASAQAHFSHHEFDQAEADYRKILDRDQNNGVALANIAMIELQQGKLAEAEKHINAALAKSPNDPYNLSTLGYLEFRQGKYNDALNALSRAAQMDPNNPEIQNYLGLALSHEGQRKQAESALRRAIQINPSYAPAQNNLAVLYLSQTPPMPELARWHYEKALAAGQPRNTDLEKMLAEKGAPVSQQ